MSGPEVTVVIPTLAADAALEECLHALENQQLRDFEVVIVDNSGQGRARRFAAPPHVRVIENRRNAGFGAAVNQGLRASSAPYLAALNDDTVASPSWLPALVEAMRSHPDAGMCASKILLSRGGLLDSAGMLVCADGSSKQRGHGQDPERYSEPEEVFFPSACAAMYRRAMLEEIGGFDESFFLYSEDTDVGLRARWTGWKCLYAPGALVEHRYSHTAGGASALKAYYVERNRLFVIAKNFPAAELMRSPLAAAARYFWHFAAMLDRRGAAARFRERGQSGWNLPWYVLRAHLALAASLGRLLKERRRIRHSARITSGEFRRLLKRYSIRPREVAYL